MLTKILLLSLDVHCSGQIVESGPNIVNPGGSLRLTCTLKKDLWEWVISGDSVKNNFWEWVRQAPGKGLEWMGQIDWSSSKWRLFYSPYLQGRITVTADASRNTYDLELRSVTAADTAIYYCSRRKHSEKNQRRNCTKA
uniref:Ig-like domain-containing protein n=1 Tax=Podarcis muralis TaxID=64176 RepID=A0A670KAB0_PODMU